MQRRILHGACAGALGGAAIGAVELGVGLRAGVAGLALVAGGGLLLGAGRAAVERWWFAAPVVLAVLGLCIGGIGVALALWVVALSIDRANHRLGRYGTAILALGASGLLLADEYLFVRRYAELHSALELGSLGLAVVVLSRWRMLPLGAFSLSVATVAAAGFALAILSDRPAIRAAIYAHSHLAARFLDLARKVGLPFRPLATIAERPPAELAAPSAALPRHVGADVVLVTVDALRPDHLGAYGYGRPVSPHVDAFAAKSTVFERAYTVIPHTSFSMTSMLTGVYTHALAQLGSIDGHTTLADRLGEAGYHTMASYPPAIFYVDRSRFASYEEKQLGFHTAKVEFFVEADDARRRTDQAIALLAQERSAPVFLWIHYFGPHEPYVAHADIDYGASAIDRYDAEIAAVDREFGRLLEYLDRYRPGAIIVLSADHGEEFGDHGGAYHGTTLYDEQVRVPLIVRLPDSPGGRITGAVSTIDIATTIAGLVGIAPSPRGTDLGVWLGRNGVGPAQPVFAELGSQKMIVLGSDKLLCDVAREVCRLFALNSDAREQVDLAEERPERAAEMLGLLHGWMSSQSPRTAVIARVAQGDRGALPLLAAALPGLSADDRVAAARALAHFVVRSQASSVEKVAVAALATLATDSDERVRTWAECARARLGLAPPPPLRAARFESELILRVAAVRAEQGDRDAVPVLVEGLPTIGDTALRAEAIAALGASRDSRALAALAQAYDYVPTRLAVIEAIAKIPGIESRRLLEARLADERYAKMRAALEAVLSQLPDR